MLKDAFYDRRGKFLKACSIDGTPVGFCGWIIIEGNRQHVEANNGQANEQLNKEKCKKKSWLLEAIDTDGWVTLSARQGIGSMMMQRIREETVRHGRCAYVLAAPEGVRLYTKFGFEIVGRAETTQGTTTSMLRQLRQS
ncbi:hypothetical protein AAE478_009430 [Parahypoxylon ruwenzoriense]